MAVAVLMPRLGNNVESSLIQEWKKKEGDPVKAGEVICLIETDKASFEVEAEEEGIILKILAQEGDDVPVLSVIAVIGNPGEDISTFTDKKVTVNNDQSDSKITEPAVSVESKREDLYSHDNSENKSLLENNGAISPRAKKLAEKFGIQLENIKGTGPLGRVIERDIKRIILEKEPLSELAKEQVKTLGMNYPVLGTGIGGRVLAHDLDKYGKKTRLIAFPGPVIRMPVKGIRKVIAGRMLESMQTTAQCTLNTSADAGSFLAFRKKLKQDGNKSGIAEITINDFIHFVTVRALCRFKEINAHFYKDQMVLFEYVHLGFAVDTPKGLMVPVIRNAQALDLPSVSREAKRLVQACLEGTVLPDELSGGTFTVTNLGNLGIESFTPILNPPQIGILGTGSIQLKPVMQESGVKFIPHIGLSLTFNHQAIDGAGAARFLAVLREMIADFNLEQGGLKYV